MYLVHARENTVMSKTESLASRSLHTSLGIRVVNTVANTERMSGSDTALKKNKLV